MVNKVSFTPGAIGYVELTYAKRKDIGYGSVQNPSGQFVKPNLTGIIAACATSEKWVPEDLGASPANAAGKDSYELHVDLRARHRPGARPLPLVEGVLELGAWRWPGQERRLTSTGNGGLTPARVMVLDRFQPVTA